VDAGGGEYFAPVKAALVRVRAHQAFGAPVGDLALGLALAVFVELDVLLSPDWRGPVAVNAVVVPAMALALVWRRRWPTLSVAVVMGGLVFLSLAFGASETWSGIFLSIVAVYSVAAYGSQLVLAASVVAVGVAVYTARDPQIETFGDAVWGSSLVGLTFLAGLAGRRLQVRTITVEQRAEAIEREEAERAAAAAAEERQRIARELHDIISHSLGVLVLQAGAAEQVLARDPERAREVLKSIRATGQEAIGEMGTLLGLVRGDAEASREPQPSLADLDRLLAKTREAGLPVDFTVEGDRRTLPAALELSAYRVVQEGLTNAVKHARSAPTNVTLRYGKQELEVEVVDRGVGLGNGLGSRRGLAGIAERVTVFGGRFEAGPRPDGGWRLRAIFPLAQ
jgi:signal transduction histidine kinase